MHSDSIEAVWVVGSFSGTRAKHIKESAANGVGYFIQDESNGSRCLAAFRIVKDPISGIPEHLIEVVDERKIQQYENRRLASRGQLPSQQIKLASEEAVETARKIFNDYRDKKHET